MNIKFTAYDAITGQVRYCGTASVPSALATPETLVLEEEQHEGGYIVEGVHFDLPAQPSVHHTYNYGTKVWEDLRTLQDIKDVRWAAIKQARNTAEFGSFVWDGSTFDSNAVATGRITGAALLAMMAASVGQPYSTDWRLTDNTLRTLSGADTMAVGAALGQHVKATHDHASTLRTQINDALTPEAVEAVTWATT